MSAHILVCPFDEGLLERLEGRALVVRAESIENVRRISQAVNRRNKLHCVLFKTPKLLSEIDFLEDWKGIPIALYAGGLGPLKATAAGLRTIRQLSMRIFLPAGGSAHYASLNILSSLGVACGVNLLDGPPEWKSLTDLMHYAVYGKASHAGIEPFHYLARNYGARETTDFASVYFEYPERYLHADRQGRIALSNAELRKGSFIAQSPDVLDTIDLKDNYLERINRRQDFFLKPDGCAYCEGWRICLGKFSHIADSGECKEFFTEMLEAVEFVKSKSDGKEELWQP